MFFFLLLVVFIFGCYWLYAYLRKNAFFLVIKYFFARNKHSEIVFHQKSASLIYSYRGKKYLINFPYHKNLIKYLNIHLFLIRHGEKIEITQQLGIPYFITAADLGGEKIEIWKDDELYKIYDLHDIPSPF